jgi:beta-ureidopropionase / N-carbamoyl-L-amino-acid hydrolase
MTRPLPLPTTVLSIDGERLLTSLMTLAGLGRTEKGGVARLALTALDGQARDLVVRWGREAGMTVTIDRIGNVFMRRRGQNAALPPIVMGSHIDTQPTGGKYDGTYGVLAGLEVVRTLNDHHIETEAPIEVVFWTNEEGSRFVPVMMGSGVFAGAFSLESAYRATDRDGRLVEDELKAIGYAGLEEPGVHPIGAYFEAHIEQGPVLEAEGVTIGVVTGVLGLRWYDCTVTGTEAHAGPTPMASRRDALQVATAIMRRVVKLAHDHPPEGRGTVGMVDVFPNSRNVIPGRVKFSIDLRHPEAGQLDRMDAALRSFVSEQRGASGLEIELEEVSNFKPCVFDPGAVALVERAARAFGYSHRRIASGAGHDAVYVARVAPAAMIFIPCKDGISHNEIEDAKPEHLTAGCNVLLHAILARAQSDPNTASDH